MRHHDVRPGARLLVDLALRDLWHDYKVSLCIVAALASVIGPLLLLFGLKHGVVSQLTGQLLDDPRNFEVQMLGNHRLDPAWFESIAQRPEAAFVVPMTRSLNAEADLLKDSSRFVANAEIIPSAYGDPVLAGETIPSGLDQVVLSARAADRLEVVAGDSLRLAVTRSMDGRTQRGTASLQVVGVLPMTGFAREAAFVDLALLVAIEDFRDGYRSSVFGDDSDAGSESASNRDTFARARLYARQLSDVAPLARFLHEQGIETRTRDREIQSVQSISWVLALIFAVIAWTAIVGSGASMAGAFLANIDRKRKDVAVLQLMGFRRGSAAIFVVIQATLLVLCAFVLGYLAFGVGRWIFNHSLGQYLSESHFACELEWWHLGIGLVVAMALALLVSLIGGWHAVRIEPAESLREV